jgi:hypothetical protein
LLRYLTLFSCGITALVLRLQLGKLGGGLLDIGREVRHLLHLANLNDFCASHRLHRS